MVDFWKRSRITKALTDGARAGSFEEAEARLDAIRVAVVLGADQMATRAGQAAALTAVATARKCFGRVILVTHADTPLLSPLPLGHSLRSAARQLGARVMDHQPEGTTHSIAIGDAPAQTGWVSHCWWDRWLTGIRTNENVGKGESGLALAGVFAAAVAVRQIFACALTGKTLRPRDTTVSLWEPWNPVDPAAKGPVT